MSRALRWLARNAHLWASVTVLLVIALIAREDVITFVGIRDSLFDTYQKLKPRLAKDAPIRVVDIDEESLAKLGQWPWPRSRLAELLQKLDDLQATSVALDILLAEPDRTSPARLLPLWRRALVMDSAGDALPDHDVVLTRTIERGRIITGFALVEASTTSEPAEKAGFVFVGADRPALLPSAPGAVSTLPMIERAAKGNGALSISLSAGGVIRHLPLLLGVGGQIYPSLTAEALRVAQGSDTYTVKLSPTTGAVTDVRIGAFDVPTDAAGQLWFYASKLVTSRYISAWKVLADDVPADALRGTIVLIGSTARGLQDVHQTPFGDDVPGVEFHAQALEQIVHEVFLNRPDWAKGAEITFFLALGATVLVVGSQVGPTMTAVVAGLAVVASWATSWLAFSLGRVLLDPLFPTAAVIAVYFVFSLLRHLQTERQQRWIRKAFASYISPKLVHELVENPGHLQLGGERKELTFIFTDLEGFTPLVEQNPPAVVVPMLNAYLDGMIRIAFQHDGTVDKIIGDAVHVMFGAPLDDPRHAERALACAIEMDQFAEAFAHAKRRDGILFGRTRIGVNSGVVIVGNFGGDLRFDYTAHGDAINTAARLEGANKYLGTRICVSENTVKLCPNFLGRPAGTLLLKGKSTYIRVYEPIDAAFSRTALAEAYARAFRMLERSDPRAEAEFADLVAASPSDVLAAFHLQRLRSGERGCEIVLSEK
jgi:adenylate cyclase